ncbi:MAG: hypothetical protein ACE5F4_01560 [Candidatus Paceibacteria bacterium]
MNRGFILLISVLVSGILLALGFAIFNIASKELTLSTSGRESQFAFYAADSGVECALYWDYQHDAFSTSSPQQPVCSGAAVTNYNVDFEPSTGTYTTVFSFSLNGAVTDPCTDVTVTRTTNPTRTTVVAAGYNTCVLTNPRRIERAIRVQY